MKTKRKKQDPLVEYIKANRKGSREAELENHGRPVSHNRIHVSKKVYNRKRMKEVCQNAHLLFYAQSPDFHKLGLCYYLKNLYL